MKYRRRAAVCEKERYSVEYGRYSEYGHSRVFGPCTRFLASLAKYRTVLAILEIVQSPVPAEYRTVLAILENALFWVLPCQPEASTGGLEYRTVLAILAGVPARSEYRQVPSEYPMALSSAVLGLGGVWSTVRYSPFSLKRVPSSTFWPIWACEYCTYLSVLGYGRV